MRAAIVLGMCTALSGSVAGCLFESLTAQHKFSDTVDQMNKATRWGQLGQATSMVDPAYRTQFSSSHAGWGELIQVADSEVVQLDLAADKQSAVSVVSYEWYMKSAMTLHQSVVRQRWSRNHDHFGLLSESVVQGDPRLLAPGPASIRPPDG
jgi:hypothetical protein